MITLESKAIINTEWDNRYINQLVDILAKRTASSLYIATKDSSRQVAMKSLIGLLSGGFKTGDEVKIVVIGDNENNVNNDMKIAEQLLLGKYD